MAKYQKFDEIPVWQESARLYQHVLDMLEEPNVPISATFRNQLERAGLCLSSCVAEGFELPSGELVPLLKVARGAAVEIQSMVAVVQERPKLTRLRESLERIRSSAESCARQLGGWKYAVENAGQNKRQSGEGHSQSPGASGRAQSPGSNPPPGANRPGR
jgi:four helix bundle protein